MNHEVIVTCAVTGAGDTVGKHPAIPVTPKQIAEAAIEAAKAGATVAHCHVRDPKTGRGSRDPQLYREVVDRIRSSGTDVIINLTAGMGGDLEIGPGEDPMRFGAGTDLVGGLTRLAHVEELLPEICTLDCGTLNFGDGDYIYVSTPAQLRAGAKRIQELGVKPELEIFDTGHLWFAKQLLKEGLLDAPPLFQICLGIPWGAPADTTTMKAMADNLPPGAQWAGFGIGRMQMPMVAQAMLLGGHVRVGLEDNIWLDKGVPATNGTLVQRAVEIIERLGGRALTPAEGRRSSACPRVASGSWSGVWLDSTPDYAAYPLRLLQRASEPENSSAKETTAMAVIVDIKTFAAIGAGVIGSGWVARALAHGLDVVAWDPAPGAEKQLRENIANAWPALERVGLAEGATPDRLRFVAYH